MCRCPFGLAAGNFYVVAMHPVIAHLEGADTGIRFFLFFEIHQKLAGIAAEIAQLIQLGVIALGNHATVADHHRWILGDGSGQQGDQLGELSGFAQQLLQWRNI